MKQRRVRALLLAAMVGGMLVPLYFLLVADGRGFAWDFHAYLAGTTAAMAGQSFVGVDAAVGHGEFVYPPVTVFAFAPLAMVAQWTSAFALHSVVSLLACGVLARLTLWTVEQRRPVASIDRLLVYGAFLMGTATTVIVGLGQVDTFVALAIAVVFLACEVDREHLAGVALGGAIVFKLFPVVILVWLVRRRAWGAIQSALAVSVGSTALGLAWFGFDVHREYLRFLLAERSRVDEFAGGMDPNFFGLTLSRPLSMLFPHVDGLWYVIGAAVLFVPILGIVYSDWSTRDHRLTAYLVTLIAMILVSPASNITHAFYLLYPLIVLLFTVDQPVAHGCLSLGFIGLAFPVQPAQLAFLIELLPLPMVIATPALDTVTTVLTFGSVGLYALTLVLLGALSSHRLHEPRIEALHTVYSE